jgi:hypothetical protein
MAAGIHKSLVIPPGNFMKMTAYGRYFQRAFWSCPCLSGLWRVVLIPDVRSPA